MVLGRQPKPMIIGMRRTALAACTLVGMCPWPITAHERWDDGSPVPEWVNRYCEAITGSGATIFRHACWIELKE